MCGFLAPCAVGLKAQLEPDLHRQLISPFHRHGAAVALLAHDNNSEWLVPEPQIETPSNVAHCALEKHITRSSRTATLIEVRTHELVAVEEQVVGEFLEPAPPILGSPRGQR
jgi:hypothetical protein